MSTENYGAEIVASLARQSAFYAENDRTIPAGPDDDVLRSIDGDPVDRRTFHNGDVVRTRVPYDDWPITVVRDGGTWRPIGIPDDRAPGDNQTDDDVTLWLYEGIADPVIEQDHQWTYAERRPGQILGDPVACFLCGLKAADLPDDERAML